MIGRIIGCLGRAGLSSYFLGEINWGIFNAMATIGKEKKDNYPSVEFRDVERELSRIGYSRIIMHPFRGKKTIHNMLGPEGEMFILKNGGIDLFQPKLLKMAKRMEGELCFRVPDVIEEGNGWYLMHKIKGLSLNDLIEKNPQEYVDKTFQLSGSYQELVRKMHRNFIESGESKKLFAAGSGYDWAMSRILLWGMPIVKAGLLPFSEIQKIQKDFKEKFWKGGAISQLCHGNIIGDHVILSDDGPYLLDLSMNPRPSFGVVYDFLRSLDFMVLKADKNQSEIIKDIPGWISKYLAGFDEEEVNLVFALRCLGALGWDMLQGEGKDYIIGDREEKTKFFLKMIRRE